MLKIDFSFQRIRNKLTSFRFSLIGFIKSFEFFFQFGLKRRKVVTPQQLYFFNLAEMLSAVDTPSLQDYLQNCQGGYKRYTN